MRQTPQNVLNYAQPKPTIRRRFHAGALTGFTGGFIAGFVVGVIAMTLFVAAFVISKLD